MQLAEALGPIRPLRGRLSGGFAHAPDIGVDEALDGLSDLGRKIERAARSRSPRDLADLGVLQLLAGEREKARATLEAAARGSRDPAILSDLAALLLDILPWSERIRALDVAWQAAAAGPDQMEAQCNFALALDEFGLVDQAREGWARCRDLDEGMGWRPEVEKRLDLLQRRTEAESWKQAVPLLEAAAVGGDVGTVRQIADRFRQRARLHVEEVELPAWAAALQEGRPAEVSRHLRVARTLGQVLRSINGDALLTEAVAVIDEATARGDGDRLRLLAEGHSAYRRGLDFFLKRENDKVVAEFERAAEAFRRARSPFRGWAVFGTQFCPFLAGQPGEQILPVMRILGSELNPSRHRALEARRLTLMGMASGRRAHFAEASHFYQDALRLFAEIGEREHLGSLHYMLGENLDLQGNMKGAWEHYLQAFQLLRDVGPSVYFRNTLMRAADVSLRQGLPSTSLLFHEERVRLAKASAEQDPLGIADALLRRSSAYRVLGGLEAARRDLEDSRAHAERMAPGQWRDRLLAELNFALGELELEIAPEHALQPLTAALDASLRSRMRYRLPLFYETRARAFLATGNLAWAQDDLERGISEVEAQRATVLADPGGAISFEQARSLFDARIDLEVQRAHPKVGFEYAERSRARTLLDMADLAGESGSRVLRVEEVQRELPSGMALIEYSVQKNRTLAWVLTRDSLQVVPLAAGEARLEGLVGELRSAVIGGRNARPPAVRLYRLLIEPLQAWIGESNLSLIFVPDRSLHLLPFAALVNPATGRYLLEERGVAKAPSATLWVKAVQRDRILAQEALSGVFVAGDPAFDRELFTELTSLPEAGREARAVAGVHPGARLILGEQATRRAFLDQAPLSSVIHLAAHATSNQENPLISALLLAREGDDPGVLYAYEIYRMRLAATRLVVLSACGTSSGKVSASEGVGSLARAFLAAGVPAVVGSLWDTQDKAASDVLIAFHRRLSQGEDPMSALRGAQLDVLRRPNSGTPRPSLWAGFELIGGVSPR